MGSYVVLYCMRGNARKTGRQIQGSWQNQPTNKLINHAKQREREREKKKKKKKLIIGSGIAPTNNSPKSSPQKSQSSL